MTTRGNLVIGIRQMEQISVKSANQFAQNGKQCGTHVDYDVTKVLGSYHRIVQQNYSLYM